MSILNFMFRPFGNVQTVNAHFIHITVCKLVGPHLKHSNIKFKIDIASLKNI